MDHDGVSRANLPADIAFDAFLNVDGVFFIRHKSDGIRWTSLRTLGAPDAFVCHLIMDQRNAFPGRTSTMEVGFIFFTKILKGGENRVRRGFPESAEAAGGGGARAGGVVGAADLRTEHGVGRRQ